MSVRLEDHTAAGTVGGLLAYIRGVTPYAGRADLLDRPIRHLVTDSRQAGDGDVFLAIKTPFGSGSGYIDTALANGAACCLVDSALLEESIMLEETRLERVIAVDNLSAQTARLARQYYADPAGRLRVIGITGTNGKSSCAHFLAQMAETVWGAPGGLIGTLGWGVAADLEPVTHTTPESVTLQRQLAALAERDVSLAAIEVSSHALLQQRTDGTRFAVAAFTNLSQDHLDYHQDMLDYARAKARLFIEHAIGCAVIGIDDRYGHELAERLRQELAGDIPILTTSNGNAQADVCVTTVADKQGRRGLTVKIDSPWGSDIVPTGLLGAFNAANLATCIACLGALDAPFGRVREAIARLQPVPGRMQCVAGGPEQPLVIVDYAHTPAALSSALHSSRQHTGASLWCVFGCGGDRDRGKRPQMGGIAEQLADKIIITSDNPRREDPQAILDDVRQGLEHPDRAHLEADREQAIRMAITGAAADDCILIAGKGHERTQQIGDRKLPFDDVEVAARILEQTAC